MTYLSKYSCLTMYTAAWHALSLETHSFTVSPTSPANIKYLFRTERGPVLLNADKLQ